MSDRNKVNLMSEAGDAVCGDVVTVFSLLRVECSCSFNPHWVGGSLNFGLAWINVVAE